MSVSEQSAEVAPGPPPAPSLGPDPFVQRALLAAIVESSEDAIVSKTLEGRILSWNAGASRIFGYRADEVIGQSITLIIPPELLDEERQILARLRRGERIDHFDTVRVTKDGRRIPISVTISPIRDATGTIVGASKVARDISERKRAEQLLQDSERTLREADRRKDEFVALLAHELRNPLAPIRYALAIAQKPDRTPQQQERAERVIARQVAHMSRLLDDLLDSSRITRGTLELRISKTELTTVVATAIETSRPALAAKSHQLRLDLPKQVVWLDADPVRLSQVFSNLLINAAKYTDFGGLITLRAVQSGDRVLISVRDDGIGISPEMMSQLFTLFSQAHGSIDRSEGGLGIGLSLARGLVRLHGGEIEAHSAGLGQGSEFIVRLPLGSATQLDEEPGEPDALVQSSGLKIVVVDDNRDGADSLAMMLSLSGHQVQTAYTATCALELAREFSPQVLIADIGLPDFSGYELAKKIRREDPARGITLIAVTGWGQQSDRRQALESGFDHHLTKPIAPEALESLLLSVEATGPNSDQLAAVGNSSGRQPE
jgi:PAS domain S-box-containing protein